MTWLQPPGYVHAMLSASWAPQTVAVTLTGPSLARRSVAARQAARRQHLRGVRDGTPSSKATPHLRLQPNDLFSASAQLSADGRTLYLRLVNMQASATTVPATIVGFKWLPAATQTVLSSGSLGDANTPAQPTFVSPVTSPLTLPAATPLAITLAPLSYTIIELTSATAA